MSSPENICDEIDYLQKQLAKRIEDNDSKGATLSALLGEYYQIVEKLRELQVDENKFERYRNSFEDYEMQFQGLHESVVRVISLYLTSINQYHSTEFFSTCRSTIMSAWNCVKMQLLNIPETKNIFYHLFDLHPAACFLWLKRYGDKPEVEIKDIAFQIMTFLKDYNFFEIAPHNADGFLNALKDSLYICCRFSKYEKDREKFYHEYCEKHKHSFPKPSDLPHPKDRSCETTHFKVNPDSFIAWLSFFGPLGGCEPALGSLYTESGNRFPHWVGFNREENPEAPFSIRLSLNMHNYVIFSKAGRIKKSQILKRRGGFATISKQQEPKMSIIKAIKNGYLNQENVSENSRITLKAKKGIQDAYLTQWSRNEEPYYTELNKPMDAQITYVNSKLQREDILDSENNQNRKYVYEEVKADDEIAEKIRKNQQNPKESWCTDCPTSGTAEGQIEHFTTFHAKFSWTCYRCKNAADKYSTTNSTYTMTTKSSFETHIKRCPSRKKAVKPQTLVHPSNNNLYDDPNNGNDVQDIENLFKEINIEQTQLAKALSERIGDRNDFKLFRDEMKLRNIVTQEGGRTEDFDKLWGWIQQNQQPAQVQDINAYHSAAARSIRSDSAASESKSSGIIITPSPNEETIGLIQEQKHEYETKSESQPQNNRDERGHNAAQIQQQPHQEPQTQQQPDQPPPAQQQQSPTGGGDSTPPVFEDTKAQAPQVQPQAPLVQPQVPQAVNESQTIQPLQPSVTSPVQHIHNPQIDLLKEMLSQMKDEKAAERDRFERERTRIAEEQKEMKRQMQSQNQMMLFAVLAAAVAILFAVVTK